MRRIPGNTDEEAVDYCTGRLLIAIGKGDFRGAVSDLLRCAFEDGFDAGKDAKRAEMEEERKLPTDTILIDLPPNDIRYLQARADQEGLPDAAAVVRLLIEQDRDASLQGYTPEAAARYVEEMENQP